MNTLVIPGVSGHRKMIIDTSLKNEYESTSFLDDNVTDKCLGSPVVGTFGNSERLSSGKVDFVIAVDNNATRRWIARSHDINWVKLIYPSAQITLGV